MKYFPNNLILLFLYIFFYFLIKNSKEDLPVHCLSNKIEGVWIFYLGDNIHDKDLKCGHKRPDQNLDHYNTDFDKIFKHKYEILIKLERPDKVLSLIDNKQIGIWTMIYDEGFEFSINENVFFSFSRYIKIGRFSASNNDNEDTKGYLDICEKTFLGWYHNKKTNLEWGCYWGEKVDNYKLKKMDLMKINYNNIFNLKKIPLLSNNQNNFSYNNKERLGKNNSINFSKNSGSYMTNSKENIINNNNNNDNNIDNYKNENLFDDKERIENNNNNFYENNINTTDFNNLKFEFLKNSKLTNYKKKDSNIIKINRYNSNNNRSSKKDSLIISDMQTNHNNKNSRSLELRKEKNEYENFSIFGGDIENENGSNIKNNNTYVDFLKSLRLETSKSKYNNIPHLDIYFLNNESKDESNERNKNFLEINSSTKLFQPDYEYVNKINNPNNKYLWKAKVYDDFIGKSYSQMRNLLGINNFFKSYDLNNSKDYYLNKNINSKNLIDETSKDKINKNLNENVFIFNSEKSNSEKQRLVQTSRNEIKNFLQYANFIEFEVNINESSSFYKTDSYSDSENNSKNKTNSNVNFSSYSYSETNPNNEDNEIDIELSEDIPRKSSEAKIEDKYGKVPLLFDWRNVDGTSYDSPVRKQGECGSCYAIAAISVMESRIRIKSNNRLKPLLSPSSILSCSRYNQGCYGGYPYLVGKFGMEFGFVEESCQPYTETDDKCFDFCFYDKNWKVKSFGYKIFNYFL